jgi:hypothetical protein
VRCIHLTPPPSFLYSENECHHTHARTPAQAEDCRAAFTSAISRRMVTFVPGPIDHFGNTPAECGNTPVTASHGFTEEEDERDTRWARGTFWMPEGPVPVSPQSAGWVAEVAAGNALHRGSLDAKL